MAQSHLVILQKPYLDAILEGTKTIESRFLKTHRQPFGSVEAADTLIFKQSSGLVRAIAKAAQVQYYENLTPGRMAQIKAAHNSDIGGNNAYWQQKTGSSCGVLIWLTEIETIEPVRINKKDRRAWVVLKKGKDFGLGKILEKSLGCRG